MFIPHFPPELFLRWVMKLSWNRTYVFVGRIFILTLVTLSAIGCAGDWGTAFEPNSLPCRIGKYQCYYGPPFGLLEYVYRFGASQLILLIPIIDLMSAVLLLFMPSRTYLYLIMLNIVTLLILAFSSGPTVLINYDAGSGAGLVDISTFLILVFGLPLAGAEHLKSIQRRNAVGYISE